MTRFVLINIWFIGDFLLILIAGLKDTPTLGSKEDPRVLSKGIVHVPLLHVLLTQFKLFFNG